MRFRPILCGTVTIAAGEPRFGAGDQFGKAVGDTLRRN
jgi:hypothetical protein